MSATRETVWKDSGDGEWTKSVVFTEKTVMQELEKISKIGEREEEITVDELDALLDRGVYAPLHNVCVFEHTVYSDSGSLTRYTNFYDIDGNFLGAKEKVLSEEAEKEMFLF